MPASSFPAVGGYIGSIWAADRSSLAYVNSTLPSLGPQAQLVLAEALAETFRNSRDAIDAFILSQSAVRGFTILNPTLEFPSGLPSATLAYIENRLSALQSFAVFSGMLPPNPSANPPAVLATGDPAVADPFFLEYLAGFSAEAPPVGLTVDTFVASAYAESAAWTAYGVALSGVVSGQAINEINYMAKASSDAAYILSNTNQISSGIDITTAWNQLVALPAIMRYTASDANDPTSIISQQTACMRNLICTVLYNAYALVVSLRSSLPAVVSTVTVRNNDTLMSIAARALGDYTLWQTIAQANSLVPPYIAKTSSPGVAGWGQSLYLPTSSGTPSGITPASYESTYLGTDIWYGPINQDMLPWTGDLQTISSYQNLAFSLGRRLQTTLGNLIYHIDFGSRIPPEIGSVLTTNTTGYLKAYAQSALASDPRVADVLSVTVTVLDNYVITLAGTVLPNGPNSTNYAIPVTANIGPITPGLAVS
jgi:nucleoid-associated protein YgaU/phage baseplate assembly protein W